MVKKEQYNAVEDLSILTTIPNNSLNKLFEKMVWVICNSVEESTLNKENITEIKIGIGTLIIGIENNSIKYKFVPNQLLENSLISTVKDGKNPLVVKLEENFANRIINTYKDMF